MKLIQFFLLALCLGLNSVSLGEPSTVMTRELQQAMTPQEALQRLKEGNQRFTSNNMKTRNWAVKIQKTATGQYPFAVILSCIDSRTPPEIVFDQGLGDIFVPRIAGNVINDDILGSMEFSTKLMGAKLIVVMGHTACGAMRGACQGAELGNLTGLLQKIRPAVDQAAGTGTKNCNDAQFIDQIAKENVLLELKQIQERSPVIKQLLQEGKIGLVGAMQNISTGEVAFINDYNNATREAKKAR